MMDEAHTPWKQSRTTVTLVANALGSTVKEGGYTQHPYVCVSVYLPERAPAECKWLAIVTESPLKKKD